MFFITQKPNTPPHHALCLWHIQNLSQSNTHHHNIYTNSNKATLPNSFPRDSIQNSFLLLACFYATTITGKFSKKKKKKRLTNSSPSNYNYSEGQEWQVSTKTNPRKRERNFTLPPSLWFIGSTSLNTWLDIHIHNLIQTQTQQNDEPFKFNFNPVYTQKLCYNESALPKIFISPLVIFLCFLRAY